MIILVVAALFHTAVTAIYHGSGKCAETRWMCHQMNGDGAGGSEKLVKSNVASLQDCYKLVKKADDKANGATWGKKNKKCYKELGMTKISSNSNYVTCFILADTSGRRRALAAEKAVGQFSWLDAKPDETPNKATYHKKGGEACTQHYECESHHCVWTADMTGFGNDDKPEGKVHCGDGYRTTSCYDCTYGEDEPDWCGGDCEWDGWECVDASDAESAVGGTKAGACSAEDISAGCVTFQTTSAFCYCKVPGISGKAASAITNVASPTPTTSTTDVVTYGFAALGASFLLYGAFRHYTSSSKGDSTSIDLA